jgi:galactose mutarotase-like enzyme
VTGTPAGLRFPRLSLAHASVAATVVPERGALVASLTVAGHDVLFLDPATLDDPTKNVRGGIPVLFPFAGRLAGEVFTPAGTTMKQHGFGRNRPWTVAEQRADGVRLTLAADDGTRAVYPYEFEADYDVRLLARGLQVELQMRNTGTRPLPVSPGWHPYFNCPAALKDRLSGDVPGLSADRLGNDREFDFGLLPPASGRSRFEVPGLGTLELSFSPVMRHLQLWSLPGRDFVCIEPFFGPENTVNTERRLEVPAGEARELWMRIELSGRG